MRAPRKRHLRLAVAAFVLLVAGCGDDDGADSTSTTGGTTADVTTSTTSPTDSTAPATTSTTEPAGPPEPTAGFDGETITLGYLTDQTGPLQIAGTSLLAGSQAYWDWVNTELGGIAGRYPVELTVGDTADDTAQTVSQYQRVKDDVVMFAQVLSTPPTQALLEFLAEDNIVAVPGSLAGQWTREAQLLPNGTPYELEIVNLSDWYVNDSGLFEDDDVFCAAAFNDKYGEDTLESVEWAGDRLGFDLAETQRIARGAQTFTGQVRALADSGCTVVFAITVVFETHGLLSEASSQGFSPVWLGTLPSYSNLLAAGGPDLYENFHVAIDPPNLNNRSVPGMADFLDRWATYGEGDPNTFHLSGYFQSIAVKALLEEAVARGDLGREGMAAALSGLGEVDLDGLGDNYVYGAPEDRVPARGVRIFGFDPDQPPNLLNLEAEMESPLAAEYPL